MGRVARRFWVPVAIAFVAMLALVPGSWQTAVAQTGGAVADEPTSTSTSTATSTSTSTTTSTATSTSTSTTTSTATATSTTTSTATSTGTATATSTALATPTSTATVIGTGTATVTAGSTKLNVPAGSLPTGSRLTVSSDVGLSRSTATATATATGTALASQSLNNARTANAQSNQILTSLKLTFDQSTVSSNSAQFKTQFAGDVASALKISVSRIRVTGAQAGFSQAPVTASAPVDNPRAETILKTPATIEFDIPDEAFVLAGGDARRIIVLRMPDDPLPTDKWFEVDCAASGKVLACTTDRFSIWMMMVIPAPSIIAQATATTGATPAGPRPASTGLGMTENSSPWPVRAATFVLLAGAVAGATGWQVSRRRRAA